MTDSERYDPAMRINTQEDADAYFEKLARVSMDENDCSRELAEKFERDNLGYWAGYGNLETRKRVERLFRCRHPLLPPATELQPSLQETFELGYRYAQDHPADRYPFPWPRSCQ
jgi:hypothetical protein